MSSRVTVLIVVIALMVAFAATGTGSEQDSSSMDTLLETSHFLGNTNQEDDWRTGLDTTDDYDLEGCQQDCRSRFGIDPYFSRGGGTSVWHLYAICIQDCNIRFWKEYDKRMNELKEESLF